MTEKLEILIGDDNIFRFEHAGFSDDFRKALPGYEINFHYEKTKEGTIEQAKTGRYDVVVTDLNYKSLGEDDNGGYEVIDEVARLEPKPLLILCTGSEYIDRNRTDGKIDYLATPDDNLSPPHKWTRLVQIFAEHYKNLDQEVK